MQLYKKIKNKKLKFIIDIYILPLNNNKMEYNILCFHGYEQSCEIMKSRMKKIEKEFKGISFDFAESIDLDMWYSVNIDKLNPLKVLTDEIPLESYQMIEDNMKQIVILLMFIKKEL
jgi:hypothetical protein